MSRTGKVTVVGAGFYGSTTAQRLAEYDIFDEVALTDIAEGKPEGLALGMIHVMMHRFGVRRGRASPSLFGEEGDEAEPSITVAANSSVYEAAVFHLFRDYDRPYYYGIDNLCD